MFSKRLRGCSRRADFAQTKAIGFVQGHNHPPCEVGMQVGREVWNVTNVAKDVY